MKKQRLHWITLTIASLLLSAGFTSAAEKLDTSTHDLDVKTPDTDQPTKGAIPCVIPCADDFYER